MGLEKPMIDTNPEQASMLLNKEDAYKYSQCSSEKVWWKCPNCGEHLYKQISNVNRRGLCCNKCSDGISFPNRFMYNVLKELNVDFISEYIIEGKKYRYDFYIKKFNIIIEMQGRQHYDGWNSKRITKEEIIENDRNKKNFAIKSGISDYIEIDCCESIKDYILNSICESNLQKYFNFENINWEKCYKNSVKSFVKIVSELYNQGFDTYKIASKIGFSSSSVVKWLHIANDLNFCNWIPLKGFLNDERPIICLTTNTIYNSISDAANCNNDNIQNISSACQGKRKYSGVFNGKPMVWMYLDEYNNPNIENFNTNVNLNHRNGISVNQYNLEGVYINTYKSIKEAKEITGITTISMNCQKKHYSAGGFRWYYIDDLNQPDNTKIQGIPKFYGDELTPSKKALKAIKSKIIPNPNTTTSTSITQKEAS